MEHPFGLRKINSQDFRIATRRTSREINRRILLNLVREHQPVSRADLVRRMQLARGGVSLLVNELIAEGLVYEGAIGDAARGRKPTFLHVRTHDHMVIAADVRFSRTDLMLSDFSGREIALETFNTVFSPKEFVRNFARRVRQLLKSNHGATNCEGLGLVVPGMVDHRSGRILNAPTLNWHNVDLREALTSATGLPVQVENAAKACVLSQMWLARDELASDHDFAFVTVSDGVGVGIVVNGELFRGHENMAGEFGHIPLSMDGPRCLCGNLGCWEAYISNIATLSRYLGRDASKIHPRLVLETERPPYGDRRDWECAPGRRQGAHVHSIHCPLSWFGARKRRQWAKSSPGLPGWGDHCSLGSNRGHCSRCPRRASAHQSTGRDAVARGPIPRKSATARGSRTDRRTNVRGDTCRVS